MRNRAYRRHKAESAMNRRLSEDRNQHYNDLSCPCWHDKKAMARFKEQPKTCSNPEHGCGNPRRMKASKKDRLTIQERKFLVQH